MTLIRFNEQTHKVSLVAGDTVPGTDSVSGEDIYFTIADVATIIP